MHENVRGWLADLVVRFGASGLRDSGREGDFIAGTADIPFDELGVDSLAAMELCISIEQEFGLSLSPVELMAHSTLGTVAAVVAESAP